MRHGDDIPQGTPRGARSFGERKDLELDRRAPFGGSGRSGDGSDPRRSERLEPRLAASPRLAGASADADDRTAARAVPEAIARWEGEGGRSC